MDIDKYGIIIPARQHVPINPVEYAKQLRRLLNLNPKMTIKELGQKLGKTEEWVLEKLNPKQKESPEFTAMQFFLMVMIHHEIPFNCLKFEDEKYQDDLQILLKREFISTQGKQFLLTGFGKDVIQAGFLASEMVAKEKVDD
jgi:hypothetical protein